MTDQPNSSPPTLEECEIAFEAYKRSCPDYTPWQECVIAFALALPELTARWIGPDYDLRTLPGFILNHLMTVDPEIIRTYNHPGKEGHILIARNPQAPAYILDRLAHTLKPEHADLRRAVAQNTKTHPSILRT